MNEIARLQKRRIMRMIITVNVLVIITIVSGCQTVKGVMGDTAWILKTTADNIKIEEGK